MPGYRCWRRQRRLIFQGERLEELATEFNRYNRAPQIRVQGAQVANRRLMGIFDADDPESLILFLRQYEDLSVSVTPREVLIRER